MIYLVLLSDILSTAFAFFAAYFLRNKGFLRVFLDSVQPIQVYLLALPVAIVLLLLVFYVFGLYEPKNRITKISETFTVSKALTFWILLIMAGSYLYKYDYSRIVVILFWGFSLILVIFGRFLVHKLQGEFYKKGIGIIKILIVGTGIQAKEVAERLENYQSVGYRLIGFLGKNPSLKPFLGKTLELQKIVTKEGVDEVYFADPTLKHKEILNLVSSVKGTRVRFKVLASIFDLISGTTSVSDLESIPSLDLSKLKPNFWNGLFKRSFDLIFGSIAFLVALPLTVFIAVVIKLTSKGPVIFKQRRVGYKSRNFYMYKFRTMYPETPRFAKPPRSSEDPRITPIGKWLRKTSLDEIPQLINVIAGEMSLVGPRPEMPQIVKKYTAWQKKRLEVKPGLTGLWQILGRKDLPLSENLEYDFYYINNQSFLLDLIIILKTIPKVLFGKGAY